MRGADGVPGTNGDSRELLAAAGVLFLDEQGRLLAVRLPYDHLHPIAIPGGGWEPADESPRDTAVREITEELGVVPELGPLACVDWSVDHARPPIAALLYWAEPLRPDQLAALRPQAEEVGWWGFLTPRQAASALPPKLSRRVTACLTVPRAAGPLELEDSLPVGHTLDLMAPLAPAPPYTGAAGLGLSGGAAAEREAPLEHTEYIAGLPRIRAKARTLFTDGAGRVLLVRLRPRDDDAHWTLPGGSVEADRELPREAARREVREELGWERGPGRLLALDWLPATGGSTRLVYVFDGGEVTEAQLAAVRLQPEELVEWRMCDPAQARSLLDAPAWSRLAACLTARAAGGGPAELVRGVPVRAGRST